MRRSMSSMAFKAFGIFCFSVICFGVGTFLAGVLISGGDEANIFPLAWLVGTIVFGTAMMFANVDMFAYGDVEAEEDNG